MPEDIHSLPPNTHPPFPTICNNGPDSLALERFKLRELAEGWPMYRDSCEWENFESIFAPDAKVYTTWTGRMRYQVCLLFIHAASILSVLKSMLDFIKVSQAGMDKGAFIMHRCHGASSDINPSTNRAVTKLKATITQRFVLDGCEVDAEADCRFCFFFEKGTTARSDIPEGEWRARFVRHWYEKDKLIPTNPNKAPKLDEERLALMPRGYRFLSYCQETVLGIQVMKDMPGHRIDADNVNGQKHDLLYQQCKQWLYGENVEP